ncbi:MAG: hypothetical protein ACRCSU_01675 [Paracoccaceae bacterium]
MTTGNNKPDHDPDPKGLIRESYAIDGIGAPECRSVFLDWALSLPAGADARRSITELLERHGAGFPDHPMTLVLRDALTRDASPGRRGGRAARLQRDGA